MYIFLNNLLQLLYSVFICVIEVVFTIVVEAFTFNEKKNIFIYTVYIIDKYEKLYYFSRIFV